MRNDPAADLCDHIAAALRHAARGMMDLARWDCIFAGVAAVRLERAGQGQAAVPDELSRPPLSEWFAEGVATARAALDRPRFQRDQTLIHPVRNDLHFTVRPGGNAAARSCQEDFDL